MVLATIIYIISSDASLHRCRFLATVRHFLCTLGGCGNGHEARLSVRLHRCTLLEGAGIVIHGVHRIVGGERALPIAAAATPAIVAVIVIVVLMLRMFVVDDLQIYA